MTPNQCFKPTAPPPAGPRLKLGVMRSFLLLCTLLTAGCDAYWIHSLSTDPHYVPASELKTFVATYSASQGMPCSDSPFYGEDRIRCTEPGWGGHSYVVFFYESPDIAEARVWLTTACCEPRWFKDYRKQLSSAAAATFGSRVTITYITGGTK